MKFRNVDPRALAIVPAVLFCIPPTVMLVYVANMYPSDKKREETDMVGQYKRILQQNGKKQILIKPITPIIWSITVVLYIPYKFFFKQMGNYMGYLFDCSVCTANY